MDVVTNTYRRDFIFLSNDVAREQKSRRRKERSEAALMLSFWFICIWLGKWIKAGMIKSDTIKRGSRDWFLAPLPKLKKNPKQTGNQIMKLSTWSNLKKQQQQTNMKLFHNTSGNPTTAEIFDKPPSDSSLHVSFCKRAEYLREMLLPDKEDKCTHAQLSAQIIWSFSSIHNWIKKGELIIHDCLLTHSPSVKHAWASRGGSHF